MAEPTGKKWIEIALFGIRYVKASVFQLSPGFSELMDTDDVWVLAIFAVLVTILMYKNMVPYECFKSINVLNQSVTVHSTKKKAQESTLSC